MPTDDLQEQVEDSGVITTSSTNPSTGQSTDYEARFKGLQREYNTLKNQLAGKEGHATTLQRENESLKQQLADIARQDQGQITQLSTEKESLKQQYEAALAERNRFEAQVQQFNRANEVRQLLLQKNDKGEQPFAALLPAHEEGILNVGDKQGDDLVQFLTKAAAFVQGQQQQRVFDVLAGASPQVQPSSTVNMDEVQLQAWLMDPMNHSNPQFPKMLEAYNNLPAS